MAITTPSSDRKIYRITEYDLLNTNIKVGNLYMCTDSKKMYEDVTSTSRQLLNVEQIATEKKRLYDTTPTVGLNYYVWETNELWLWNNKWVLIIGNTSYPVAYQYVDGDIYEIDANGVVGTNGILDDGSVVVRDINRIIKGKIYIDETNDNLIVSSFLGGGMKFLANGLLDTSGTLDLSEDAIMTYWGEFNTYGGEMYVTYPSDDDPSLYPDPSHKYLVYHSGNMSIEHILNQLTGEKVYTLLKKYNTTVNPLLLNVDKLDGYHASQLAKAIHTHNAEDISDLLEVTRSTINTVTTTGKQIGITVGYDVNNNRLNYTVDSFTLALTGGVTGSAVVSALSDTTLNVVVDPSKHTHTIDIEEIIGGTELVNKVNILETSKLSVTDFNALTATVATPNKLLYLDANGDLPTNITGKSVTADKLTTGRKIELIDGVTGSAVFDGSEDLQISVIVDPTKHEHNQYLLGSEVGKSVAQLIDGKVPVSQLPDSVLGSLQYQGTFDPNDGLPEGTTKGQYWVSIGDATVGELKVDKNDWIVYNGTGWDVIDNTVYVNSVNGRTGDIIITLDELNGISNNYLNYGETEGIPQGKLVLTDYANHLPVASASADKLSSPFKMTFKGDFTQTEIDIDGSQDVEVNLSLSDQAKEDIKSEIQAEVNNVFVGKYRGEYNAAELEGMIPSDRSSYNNGDWYVVTSDFIRANTTLAESDLRFDEVYAGDTIIFIAEDNMATANITKDMWHIHKGIGAASHKSQCIKYIENNTTSTSDPIVLDFYYSVGSNDLQVYINGSLQTIKTELSSGTVIGTYEEVGVIGEYSNTISLYNWGIDYIPKGTEIKFIATNTVNNI